MAPERATGEPGPGLTDGHTASATVYRSLSKSNNYPQNKTSQHQEPEILINAKVVCRQWWTIWGGGGGISTPLSHLFMVWDQAFLFSKVYLARRLDSDLVGVVQYGGE